LAATLSFTGAAGACAPKNIKPEVVSPPPIVQQYAENQTTGGNISTAPLANNYEKNRKEFESLLPTMDKTFADWVINNRFTQENGTISDDELKVLKEPKNEQYVLKLYDDYISEVNGVNPDLAFELKRLPEIKENVEAKTLDVKDLEPLEDIVVAAQNPKYKKGFEGMLNEGIRDKIKLNASIEVLYEGLFSEEIDENFAPLLNYSVYNLYVNWFSNRFSKTASQEYQNYKKKMVEDFEYFTERMISPNWVAWAVSWMFKYGGTPKQMRDNLTPQEYFKLKEGTCIDFTALTIYCLKPKGYDNTRGLWVGLDRPYTKFYGATGHVVPIFLNPKDNLLYVIDTPWDDMINTYGEDAFSGPNLWSNIDDYYKSKTGVYGPYSSEEEAANDTNRRLFGDPKSKARDYYSTANFDMATGKFK
jgi:hypothetical protein